MRAILVLATAAVFLTACGESAGGADLERFCELLDEIDAQDTTGMSAEESLPVLEEGRARFVEGAQVAPEEIKADAEMVADGAVRFTDLLIAAGGDESQVDPAEMETVQAEVFTEDFDAAVQSVDAWRLDNCPDPELS